MLYHHYIRRGYKGAFHRVTNINNSPYTFFRLSCNMPDDFLGFKYWELIDNYRPNQKMVKYIDICFEIPDEIFPGVDLKSQIAKELAHELSQYSPYFFVIHTGEYYENRTIPAHCHLVVSSFAAIPSKDNYVRMSNFKQRIQAFSKLFPTPN